MFIAQIHTSKELSHLGGLLTAGGSAEQLSCIKARQLDDPVVACFVLLLANQPSPPSTLNHALLSIDFTSVLKKKTFLFLQN